MELNTFINLIDAAESLPITLDELKIQLPMTDSGDEEIDAATDARLTRYIKAAAELIEAKTNRSYVAQSFKYTMNRFPSWCDDKLELPKPPLVSVESVKYYNTANELTTLVAPDAEEDIEGDYRVIAPGYKRGWIEPVTSWPATYSRSDAVQIEFTAGFATVPERYKQAIHLICGAWNELREDENAITTRQIELGTKIILATLKTGQMY